MRHYLWLGAALLSASCMTMGRMDSDGDTKISRDEAAASPDLAAAFGVADANDDGYLDATEFEAAKEWLSEQAAGSQQPSQQSHGGHRH